MKILNTRQITDLNHLNLVRVDYQDRNGTDKSWIYASRQNPGRPDAVVVVPVYSPSKELVLIREFRVPLAGYQYGFPAGLVDAGEDIETAGKRELYEETGLTATQILKTSPPVFSSSGMTDESISLLYVRCEGMPDTAHNEASEDIQVVLVCQDEARALLDDPALLFDVKTWIVLDRFARTGQVL